MSIFNFDLLNLTTHSNKKFKNLIVKSIRLLLYLESKIVTYSKLCIINSLNIAMFENYLLLVEYFLFFIFILKCIISYTFVPSNV